MAAKQYKVLFARVPRVWVSTFVLSCIFVYRYPYLSRSLLALSWFIRYFCVNKGFVQYRPNAMAWESFLLIADTETIYRDCVVILVNTLNTFPRSTKEINNDQRSGEIKRSYIVEVIFHSALLVTLYEVFGLSPHRTQHIIRCSLLIQRDHLPTNSYFKGSGFPMPSKGFSWIACITC